MSHQGPHSPELGLLGLPANGTAQEEGRVLKPVPRTGASGTISLGLPGVLSIARGNGTAGRGSLRGEGAPNSLTETKSPS